jgi:hypothetical protein
VSVRVIASGFQPNAQIKFTGSGADINGTNVIVVSPNILTATVDLTNATPGVRTVVVTNPDHSTVTLSNAFTIQQGGAANVQIQKIGNPPVDGRNETFYITVSNTGTVDSGSTSFTELMEPWFTFVSADPPTTSQLPVGYPYGQDYNGYLVWTLPNIPAGQSVTAAYTVKLPPQTPDGASVEGTVCEGVVKPYCEAIEVTEILLVVPATCTEELLTGPAAPIICWATVGATVQTWASCERTLGYLCSTFVAFLRKSADPNDLTGPPGYGTQMWIAAPQQMPYALSFNNSPSATNPATNVYLTDTFDPTTLDLSTLTVGAITFGSFGYSPPSIPLASQPFSHDIDLRPAQDLLVRVTGSLDPATHQVTVNLLSLDPATGLTPTDPTVGFLAPGEGGGVQFTVAPKGGLTTGTQISDQGTVVFDSNPPMSTAVWTNTLDNTPPTSRVSGLPAKEACADFNVGWSSNDIGAGVQSLTVYVSDNGANFAPWLTYTTLASSVFQGQVGHTYGFYSIATDLVANIEPSKSAPEASTKVASGNSCGPPNLSGTASVNSYSQGVLSLNVQLSDIGTADAVNVMISQLTFRTLSGSGNVTLSSPKLPIGVGNIPVNNSTPVTLNLSVPATVKKFSITESGTMQDSAGKKYNYSIGQNVITGN